MAFPPRAVGDEAEVEEPVESTIDFGPGEGESSGHPLSSPEGRAAAVGGQSEQHQDGRGVRPEVGERALVQQPSLQPPEARLGPTHELGMRRRGRRSHGSSQERRFVLAFFALRAAARLALRSRASFARYESPSIFTISE